MGLREGQLHSVLKQHWRVHAIVHLTWIILILAALLIGLLSARLSDVDGLKDILNFALALSSLTLAALAIVQAIVSQGSQSDTLSEVHRAISSVSGPADKIAYAAELITSYSQHIGVHAQAIQSTMGDLNGILASRGSPYPGKATEAFSAAMVGHSSMITKAFLYALLQSYNHRISYSHIVPTVELDGVTSIEYPLRAMFSLALDGGSIGVIRGDLHDQWQAITVSELGLFAWLQNSETEVSTISGEDMQRLLQLAIVEIDKNVASLVAAS